MIENNGNPTRPYRAAYGLAWHVVRSANGAETWLPTEYDERDAAEAAAANLNRQHSAA